MKKIKIALINTAIIVFIISSFVACDKDFIPIGSDIVGNNHFGTQSADYEVVAYNKVLDNTRPVQTNNLPLNYLGAYKDPLYGLTTASFLTQLSSSLLDPDFGTGTTLDSVVLTVPYFSRPISNEGEGVITYELDSIFGSDPITLSLFESNYFLRSFDPNSDFDLPQYYYSNASTSATENINTALFEGTPLEIVNGTTTITSLDNFIPSDEQIELWDEDDEVSERLAPALRVKLDTTYWRTKIFDKQGEPELSNANNFNNYFKGLYFKAEANNGSGSLALLNFGSTAANITIYYTKDSSIEDAEPIQSTYVLTFGGNRVNIINNNFTLPLSDGDNVNGDARLYLKGAAGSMAVVELFNTEDEFNDFKNLYAEYEDGEFVRAKRLINEANLVFYVDQNTVVGQEPERIFLYDLDNKRPLIDFSFDLANTANPAISYQNHLGALQRVDDDPNGEGIKYKVRITEHLNNLILRDSTNVKLGVAVTGNVNLESNFSQFRVQPTTIDDNLKRVPVSSIITPRGTVLYGNNTTEEAKKLYLEIFYTEPNDE